MRVLLVEDEPKMAALLRRGLERNGDVVDITSRGEDALWMAQAREYDVIVLDVTLPGIDGFRTCRRLRAVGVRTAVLMLTARGAVDDRVAGLDGGADDYVVKPFSMAELSARLRALARRGPIERPPVPRRRRAASGSLQPGAYGVETPRSTPRAQGVRAARALHVPSRATRSRDCSCSSTAGTTGTRSRSNSSTSTWGVCGPRSTAPSACARSRPCGAPGIDCATTAAHEARTDQDPPDARLHRGDGHRPRRHGAVPVSPPRRGVSTAR